MLRYLIFITIGILLYLLLNRYNTFSIGAILRIPLGTSLVKDQIYFPNSENVAHTPRRNENYRDINQIYWVNDQYYYYTDINMDEIMYGTYDETLIDTINNNIEQERLRLESERLERERLERLERERLERLERERQERQERERQDFVKRWSLLRTPTDQVNRLRTGHIIAYMNEGTTIIRQLNDGMVGGTARPLGIPTIEIDELTEITDLYYVIRLDEQVTDVPYWWNTIQMTGTILGMGGDTNIDINIRSLLSILRYLPLDMAGVTGGPFNFIQEFNRLSPLRSHYRTHLLQIITAFLTLQLGGTRQNILNIGQLFRYLNYHGPIPSGVVTTDGGATTGGATTGGGAPSDATQEVPDVVISGTGATMTFRGPSTRRNCAASEGIPPPSERK